MTSAPAIFDFPTRAPGNRGRAPGRFPDDGIDDNASRYAAKMAKANITDGTRTGHLRNNLYRILKHYFIFHLRRNKDWDANRVDEQTPRDIAAFITQNVARLQKVLREERPVEFIHLLKCYLIDTAYQYSTAVSTRAALTMWYRGLRPNESTGFLLDHVMSPNLWWVLRRPRPNLEKCRLPRALSLDDMHRLYDHCLNPSISLAEKRAGIVQYVAYLLAWLMIVRVDEVIHLTFENIDKIPGERWFLHVGLNTRKQNQTGLLHSWKLWGERQ
ncbi:hypothetical protein B0H14DRAFT_3722314 [Mycena olivaceomarginata]|nr:hypothetical protein B0H14DRAFT_3722314 [Mycena olivaceomarginata]